MTDQKPVQVEKILENLTLVVFQTQIGSPIRDTKEGNKSDSRIEKVLQRCYSPSILRPLGSIKQRTMRLLREYGSKVDSLYAYAVPNACVNGLIGELRKLKESWDCEASQIAEKLTTEVAAWAQLHPKESSEILRLAPTQDEFVKKTRFVITAFEIGAERVIEGSSLQEDLTGLASQTFHEMAAILRDSNYHKRGTDKAFSGESVRTVLGKLIAKSESMSFIDDRLKETAIELRKLLKQLPAIGPICGIDAITVRSVIDHLLNPAVVREKGFSSFVYPSADPSPGLSSQAAATSATPMVPAVPSPSTSVVSLAQATTAVPPQIKPQTSPAKVLSVSAKVPLGQNAATGPRPTVVRPAMKTSGSKTPPALRAGVEKAKQPA